MIILLHSSKTMRPLVTGARPSDRPSDRPGDRPSDRPSDRPALLDRAEELVTYLRTLSPGQLSRIMSISADLAVKTREQFAEWSTSADRQAPAAASFVGDIYSGLRIDSFNPADRRYAGTHLRILSGLYGILRPFDGISPYRLEMGYRLPAGRYANLYRYWDASIADQLPAAGRIINLAAGEYSRTVIPHVDADRMLTPRFLTADPAAGQPKFVAVHAKIARGAFARWLVTERVRDDPAAIREFDDIGYRYDEALSTPREPTFVCQEFGGKGLSVRLT